MEQFTKLSRFLTLVGGTITTLLLSFVSGFVLNLSNEITWLTFFIGALFDNYHYSFGTKFEGRLSYSGR